MDSSAEQDISTMNEEETISRCALVDQPEQCEQQTKSNCELFESFSNSLQSLISEWKRVKVDCCVLETLESLGKLLTAIRNLEDDDDDSSDDGSTICDNTEGTVIDFACPQVVCRYIKYCFAQDCELNVDKLSVLNDSSKTALLMKLLSILPELSQVYPRMLQKMGLLPYVEHLALQRKDPWISYYCFLIVRDVVRGNLEFLCKICRNVDYIVRICELIRDENLQSKNIQITLLLFWELLLFCSKAKGPKWKNAISNGAIVACAYLNRSNDCFVLRRALNVMNIIFSIEFRGGDEINEPITRLLETSVPRVVALTTSTELATESIRLLATLASDLWESAEWLHIALGCGIMTNLLHHKLMEDSEIFKNVMSILNRCLSLEQPINHSFLPCICFHIQAKTCSNISDGIMTIQSILKNPAMKDYANGDRQYIENHPDVVQILIDAIRNLDERLRNDDSSFCVLIEIISDCLELLMGFGSDPSRLNGKIANMFGQKSVFDGFMQLKNLDIDHYDLDDIADCAVTINLMRAYLKRLFELNGQLVENIGGIFDDLPEISRSAYEEFVSSGQQSDSEEV